MSGHVGSYVANNLSLDLNVQTIFPFSERPYTDNLLVAITRIEHPEVFIKTTTAKIIQPSEI